MSAEHNFDADAFMRKYLECPSDATARLVFADWLEETGEEHNAAWAHFIRLKVEADRYPTNSPTRHEIDRHAGQYAVSIRARLAIPAKLFVGYPKSLLELLPAENITVRLAEFEVPRDVLELVPESVARENLVLPLATQDRVLLVAAANPCDYDTAQKLEFILNRDIIFVGADRDDIQAAFEREYGLSETESVDSAHYAPLLTEFTDPPSFVPTVPTGPPPELTPGDRPVIILVNLLFTEAIQRRADEIRIVADPESAVVSYLTDGAWVERDRLPRRLLRPVTARLATMAWLHANSVLAQPPSALRHRGSFSLQAHGIRFQIDVTIEMTPDGPSTHLTLRRVPLVVEDQ